MSENEIYKKLITIYEKKLLDTEWMLGYSVFENEELKEIQKLKEMLEENEK